MDGVFSVSQLTRSIRTVTFRCKRCLATLLLTLCAYLSAVSPVLAREIHYLALQGEGSASVIIDDEADFAVIADGGSAGKQGIKGALIEGKDVLTYLIDKGVKRVAISCSHPDADHMNGLKWLVSNERISSFEKVLFVDNGRTSETNPKLLREIYLEKINPPPDKWSYVVANNANAFDGLSDFTSDWLRVSTFKYEPVGKSDHDAAVILQYVVGPEKDSRNIVDFDDASTRVITQWVKKELQANVLILPHHGSRYNKIAPILNDPKKFGIEDVIITVNRNNRYLHPAPEVLLELVKTFKADHVLITDSDAGLNITFGSDGRVTQVTRQRNQSALTALIDARIEQAKRKQGRLKFKSDSEGGLDIRDKNAYEQTKADIIALEAARAEIHDQHRRRKEAFALMVGGQNATNPEGIPVGPPPNTKPNLGDGTGAFNEKQNQSNRAPGGAGRATHGSNGPPGSGPGRGGGGGTYFTRYRSQAWPVWGGVILGALPSGPGVNALEFVPESQLDNKVDQDTSWYILRFTMADSRIVDYIDVSPLELWAAYNFVQPTPQLASNLPYTLTGNAAGLVGMAYINKKSNEWYFGIHPAIANSPLAQAAMRLDMFYAAAAYIAMDPKIRNPSYLRNVQFNRSNDTYQWYDDPARIEVQASQLVVNASTEPSSCLMRLRLVDIDLLVSEYKHQLERRSIRVGEDDLMEILEGQQQAPQAEMEAYEAINTALIKEDKKINGRSTQDYSFNKYVDKVCESYPPLASIDRLARLIAIFNWYTASGKHLPPLPDNVSFPEAMRVEPRRSLGEEIRALAERVEKPAR